MIRNFFGHLHTICHHRRLVRRYCFRLGLYRQGLMHDLSKFSPVEFWAGVRFYQGDRSPNNAQRDRYGYSAAWMHHKGRNKHHFEYWTDYSREGGGIVGIRMPVRYVGEMFCDRLAASRVYRGDAYTDEDPWKFFDRSRGQHLIMNAETEALLGRILWTLKEQGEDAAFDYVRGILKNGYPDDLTSDIETV